MEDNQQNQQNQQKQNIIYENNNKTYNFDTIKQECLTSLSSLLDNYKTSELALSKIKKYCNTLIKTSVENSLKAEITRNERIVDMREKSESFISSFLDSYPQYFYFQNNTFVSYDGEKYELCSEDQISNRIIVILSMNHPLSSRKHKIRASIIKRLRERGTIMAVPSSHTIQNVLRPLYPSIFETRNETKYFLTIIGDVLMKKHSDNVFFVHHRAKEFIDYLISGLTFLKPSSATTLSNLFKYKFQNHSFANSRSLRIQGSGDSLYYPNINVIDLFFVAQYYSTRYGTSEDMLSVSHNLSNNVKILGNIGSEQGLIDWFIDEAFIPSENETLNIKTVQFMWKRFCTKKKIPNAIQNNNIVKLALNNDKVSNSFDNNKHSFINYKGNHEFNPSIDIFNRFWEETIILTDSNEPNYEFKQLEIDELITLFTSWERKHMSKLHHRHSIPNLPNLDEDVIVSYIKHFYPSVDIEDEKYLNGITCSLWDKQREVSDFIEHYLEENSDDGTSPVEAMYREYRDQMLRTNLSIANKGYFEKIYNHFV